MDRSNRHRIFRVQLFTRMDYTYPVAFGRIRTSYNELEMIRLIKKTAETVLVAAAAGLIFSLLHIPLPWMLGPLAGVMVWNAATKRPVHLPIGFRHAGLVVLGYLIGSSFTLETGREIASQLPSMLLSTVLLVAGSLAIGWLFSKWMNVSLATGIIGSVPGGLSQMAVLGEELRTADVTTVTFMQTVRLLTVIFVVPFLALHAFSDGQTPGGLPGAFGTDAAPSPWWHAAVAIAAVLASPFVAQRLKLPTAHFLGPVLAIVIVVLCGLHPPQIPRLWVTLAQIAVGTHLGTTMQLHRLQQWRRLLPSSVLLSLATVGISLVVSVGLMRWHAVPLLDAFLGTSPGGMAEMGLTAAMTGGDVTFVAAYQMFRILFILFLVPPALRWALTRLPEAGRG